MKQTVLLLLFALVGVTLPQMVTASSALATYESPAVFTVTAPVVVTTQHVPNVMANSAMPKCGSGELEVTSVGEWLSQWSCGTLPLALLPVPATTARVAVQNIQTPNIVVARTSEFLAQNNVSKGPAEQPFKFITLVRNFEDFYPQETNGQEFSIEFITRAALAQRSAGRYVAVEYALLC